MKPECKFKLGDQVIVNSSNIKTINDTYIGGEIIRISWVNRQSFPCYVIDIKTDEETQDYFTKGDSTPPIKLSFMEKDLILNKRFNRDNKLDELGI